MSALDPSVSSAREAANVDEFLELAAAVERDVTADRVVFFCGGGAPHVIADLLPSSFVERRECARYPEQVVWADDDELAIVVCAGIADDRMRVAASTTAELWASEDGFHRRLDELAPLAVTV